MVSHPWGGQIARYAVKNGATTGTTGGCVKELDSFTRIYIYAEDETGETSVQLAVVSCERKRVTFSAPEILAPSSSKGAVASSACCWDRHHPHHPLVVARRADQDGLSRQPPL